MKKVFTGIAILLAVALVAFLIGGLLGSKNFKMERSIEINAPRAAIYKNLSDYNNWLKWSPWAKIDSNCKYDFYGQQGQVGAGYKWQGNNKVGEGDMHTTEMLENTSLTCMLSFIKPFKSVATATFKLEDGANGTTKVTWGFSQDYSFAQRPMMLVMNMEKMLGGDYESGLSNLKTVCEQEAKSGGHSLAVKEVNWEPHTYVANRSVVEIRNIAQVFQEKMPKTFIYVKKNKFEVMEPVAALFYTWDTVAGKSDLAMAVQVKDASKASGEFSAVTLGKSKALLVDFYGPYDKTGQAHDAIKKYAADKGLKIKYPAIEEYVTDPGVEKDPNKVLTKVYYLVEG